MKMSIARPWRAALPSLAWGLAWGLSLCCGAWPEAQAATQDTAQAAPRLPTEAFARLPQLNQVSLSPDGTWFAAIMNRGNDTVAIVRPLDGSAPPRALLKNDNRESTLAWLHWISNERVVISVHYPAFRGNTQTVESRLVSVARDGGKAVPLLEPSALVWGSVSQFADQVIDWLPEDGHHLLLQARSDSTSASPAVFRVNVDTGERVVVHGRRFGVQQWMTDQTHRVRVGVQQQGTHVDVLVCDADGGNWRTAWSYELFEPNAVVPLGFGADPNLLYIRAEKAGRAAVFEVDLRDPALPRKLVLDAAGRDVSGGLVRDPATGRVLGLRGNAGDGVGGVGNGGLAAGFWDPATKTLARDIDNALPGRLNRLLEFSGKGARYVVYSSGNGQPGRYLVGERSTGQMQVVGAQYPELAGVTLPRKQAFTIAARDGLELPAFLTLPLPAEGSALQRLPTVLLPHGGPLSADSLDFDPLAQFLANRGYAVLQVNFRGSAGQGYDFAKAGMKRWGLEMQDDLTDALQWLVQRGTADPARVCIVGGSYGGYAALMGGAKTPQLYRCIVSLAGVSDLPDMAEHRARYVNGLDVFSRQVGSAWGDRAQLIATSPSRLAAQFQAPVLLVHGTNDRSVPYAQSETMLKALQAAGKDVRLVTLDKGDHNLGDQGQRLQFYRELEDFLARHIGAAEPSK